MSDYQHSLPRRSVLKAGTAMTAFASMSGYSALAADPPQPVKPVRGAPRVPPPTRPSAPPVNRAPLAAQPFIPLPTGTIRPAGWLERQLVIQAKGLGGRLDETWPDVGQTSGWLGGPGEKWERGPYFLDGLLPLAWALDDAGLKAKAQAFVEWTLASAKPDGMFGPADNDDWWPRMVMLKVLAQYHELTGDPRATSLMTAYFRHQLAALPARPLRDWGRFRWQDNLWSVLWLYNRIGDAELLKLAPILREQGWDWQAEYANFPFKEKTNPKQLRLGEEASGDLDNTVKDIALSAHGVNAAMGLKAPAVWSLVSNNPADRAGTAASLATLDRYHGLPIGIFSADEHFAGRSPSQGVETCTVVEALFSLEQAMAITGEAALGDRIERIAYNAMPAAFTDDMWAHQYDQQPNQIASVLAKGPWTTNGPESNLFGLEPHFGCCTANFHQGWPKLLNSTFMATDDGGIAAMIYAPVEVSTVVGGTPLRIASATDYPFRDTVAITLTPAKPTSFPLKLRVPAWSRGITVTVNGRATSAPVQGRFATIARAWAPGDVVAITFLNETRAVIGHDGAATIEHGPLLYALPIGTKWTKWRQRGLSTDWQVTATSPWNYALVKDAPLSRQATTVPTTPFGAQAAGSTVTATLVRVPAWRSDQPFAPPPPENAKGEGAPERITLVPYAAAKLRITAFPVVAA